MITAEIFPLLFGSGGLTVDVRVTVRSDADGIGFVRLQDRHGVPIIEFSGLACVRFHSFEVTRISREQLPLFVLADECSAGSPSGQPGLLGPFTPGTTDPNGIRMCPPPEMHLPPSQQCLDARNRATQLRNEYQMACRRVHDLRARLTYETTTAGMYYFAAAAILVVVVLAAAAGLAAIATGVGAVIGAILIAAAALLAFLAGYLLGQAISFTRRAQATQRELTQAERDLATKAEQFFAAAMNVRNTCCPGDFFESDVTLPPCSN